MNIWFVIEHFRQKDSACGVEPKGAICLGQYYSSRMLKTLKKLTNIINKT